MRFLSPGDTHRSKAHRHIEGILNEMNINFDSEVAFKPYRVDLYLSEWHFVIEVDGPQHSSKKDLVRDQTLEIAYHLRVLHIPTGKRKQEVIDLITEAAENWAGDAEERKRYARQPAT
jgi:very-short-patch-repair endonuclease